MDTVSLVILGGIILLIFLIALIHSIKKGFKKHEISDWEIGDKIRFKTNSTIFRELERVGLDLATLEGWELDNLYVSVKNTVYQVGWEDFDYNKSAIWRRNYDKAKSVMGSEPNFYRGIKNSTTESNGKVDGKPIDLLNETECQVQLKIALENEDYDLANLLKERLEKFR
jgi:hypothetical protein